MADVSLRFPTANPLPWRDSPLVFENISEFIKGSNLEIAFSNSSNMSPITFQAIFNITNYQQETACKVFLLNDRLFVMLDKDTDKKEWAGPGNVYVRIKLGSATKHYQLNFMPHVYDLKTTTEFDGVPFYIKEKWHTDIAVYLERINKAYGITVSIPRVIAGEKRVDALDITNLRYRLERVSSVPFQNLGLPVEIDPINLWAKNIVVGTYKNPGHWKEVIKYCQSYASVMDALTVEEPVLSAFPASGLYADGLPIQLQMTKPGTIYYTTDGSFPTTNSEVYSSPISLSGNVVLKAIGVADGGMYSNLITESYTAVRPSTLSVTNDERDMTFSWTAVAGATGYNIYEDESGVKINPSPIMDTSYHHIDLSEEYEKTYYLKVIDILGNESLPSNKVTVILTIPAVYKKYQIAGSSRGAYIEDVNAPLSKYPDNGPYTDGFWYVRIPEAPTDVYLLSHTDTSATLSWTLPEYDDQFVIVFSESGAEVSHNFTGTSGTINNLTPNTEYTLKIYGLRSDVRSETFGSVTLTTFASVPKLRKG